MEQFICRYCGKVCKNKNSLAQHEIRCKENPNKISMDYLSNRDQSLVKRNPSNQFIKANKLGLPQPTIAASTRLKLSNVWKGKKHSEDSKQRISKAMQIAVRKNPDSYSSSNVNGRVKKAIYKDITFDSQWEVDFAKYCDNNNINWERPKLGIEYIYEDKKRIYYPDFYLPTYDVYVEVKGYERDKDIYKWKSLTNLLIIKHREIKDIRLNKFSLLSILNNKFGPLAQSV